MKQRALSVILAICLLLGLLSVSAAAEHTHEGRTPVTMGTTYIKLGETEQASNTLTAGSYYLDTDLTVPLTIEGEVSLCLSGHSVTCADNNAITVPAGASLTLTDCGLDSTGKATYTGSQYYYGVYNSGAFTLVSGAVEGGYRSVYNNSGATFTMTGGTVAASGNSGYGVTNGYGATFTMTGGTVTASGTSGYGVFNASSSSVFKLSGGAVSGGKYGVYNYYSASQLYLSGAPAVHGGTADIRVYVDDDSACIYADDGAAENPVPYSGDPISLAYSSLSNGYTAVLHVTEATKDKFTLKSDYYSLVYDESAGTLKLQGKPMEMTWYGIDGAPLSGEDYPETLPYETELFPADLPAAPAVEGKLFLCWQYSTDGGETWEKFDDYDYHYGVEITGPMTFQAVYADAFPGGSGTESDPYQIASAADLQNLAVIAASGGEVCNNSKVWYQLTADIDLSAVCGPEVGSWTPIGGGYDTPFHANLDGNGKTISNLYISGSGSGESYDAQGLFGYIVSDEYDEEAEEYVATQIRDLTLTDVSVSGEYYVGALVGSAYHVNLSGCAVTGSVSGEDYVGGLAGGGYDTQISGCDVNGTVNGGTCVGGLVGSAYSMDISGCAVSGAVTGREYVGALTGRNTDNTAENNDMTGVTVVSLPPEDYTVDGTQTMAYKADNNNTIDVKGRYNGAWLKTTYADNGYYVATSGMDGATVTSRGDFINSGRYVKLSYTVTAGDAAVSGGKLTVHADIQIGENDSAAVEAILNAEGQAVGLRMVDDNEDDNSCGAQFNLYFAGTGGVTDVSTYWFGKYNDRDKANDTYGRIYFAPLNDDTKSTSTSAVYEKNDAGVYTKLSGVDSGFAISWQGIDLAAGESKTYSLVLGVGAKSDPPQWDASNPLSLTLEASDEGRILHVTVQVSDAPGLTDTLYYCVDDGPEGELGSVLADGQTEFIFGTVDLTDYEPGTYTFSFWVVNSAGAASTSVDKVVTITADGVEGVDPPPAEDPDAPSAHLHSWAVGWTADEAHHWHQCQTEGCTAADSEKYGYGEHAWDGGAVTTQPTYAADGVKTYTCTVCGRTKTETVPKLTHHFSTEWTSDESDHWHICTDDGCTETSGKAAHVYDNDQDADCNVCGYQRTVTPVDPGEALGEVEVKPGTPAVSVDEETLKGLAGTPAEGKTVTVKLTVEKQDVPEDKATIDAIAGNQTANLTYLDLSLTKTTTSDGGTSTTAITDTGDTVLEIAVPFDFTDKTDVTVYRCHGGAAEKLTQTDTRADGTFRLDEAGDKVFIYASKFSTYAIGYIAVTNKPTPAPGSGVVRPVAPPAQEPQDNICPRDGTCPIAKFTDASTTAWYHDGVHYCVEKGLMLGTSETTFAPAMTTSRATLATILWRQEGSPVVHYALQYDDVAPDAWYTEAVRWATSVGVVNGYGNGKFGPNDPITREQLATMLWRYAQAAGRDVSVGEDANILSCKDFDQINEYAIPALQWAAGCGVVQSKVGGVLDPQGKATRAEAAAMLQRFCEGER